MKNILIKLLKILAKIPYIPFNLKLMIAIKDRRLRDIIPLNKNLIYDKYLGDIKVNISTNYPIEKEMLTGRYDPETSFVLRKFLNCNCIVIDVGANVGAITLLMAQICDQGGVIAIEPGPLTSSRLMDNLMLNPKLQALVTVCKVGVSDKKGKLFWSEDPENLGNASLWEKSGILVEVETLDNIIEENRIKRLDFIKIDVEGMEYEVIKGGLDSIRKYHPTIYYETLEPFRDFRGFDLYKKIFDLLSSEGYKHFYVNKSGAFIEQKEMAKLYASNALAIHISNPQYSILKQEELNMTSPR